MPKKQGKNTGNGCGLGKQGAAPGRTDNMEASEMDGCRTKKGKNICNPAVKDDLK